MKTKLPDLTGKQRTFVQHYLTCLNATEAARRSGYKGDDNALGVVGHRNLRNDKIRAHLDYHFQQQAMSEHEVIARLTEQARADLSELTDADGAPDWNKARAAGKTHLVKKIKRKQVEKIVGKAVIRTTYTEIELHDPQRAIDMLGKYHELFTSKVKIEDWHDEAIADIRSGRISYEALAQAFDESLAAELFRKAGVPVQVGASAPADPGD